MKNYEKMEELKEWLETAVAEGNRHSESAALYGIGQIYFKEDIPEAAEDYWKQCEAVCREIGLKAELGQVLLDLGELEASRDGLDAASHYFREALDIFEESNNLQGVAKTRERLGNLSLMAGRPADAAENFRAGLDLCRAHGDKIGALFFMEQLVPLVRDSEDPDKLEAFYRELITAAEKVGDRERMALHLVGLADILGKSSGGREREPYLVMAHDLFLRVGREEEAGLIRLELDRIRGKRCAEKDK